MKTEWTFGWKSYDFHFKKEHKFIAKVDESENDVTGPADGLEVLIRVVPSQESPHDRTVEQFGDLLITVPLRPEDAEPVAYRSAQAAGEQIAFRNGDFRVEFGFVACKCIAESGEEEAEIDGKPYSVRMHLKEVVATPEFDGAGISSLEKADMALLSEYNQAKRDENPIRQFLAFFRIIESFVYSGGTKGSLKSAFATNAFLQRHFASLQPIQHFDSYINKIVEIRHRCAHLKGDVGFGYSPNDPAVKNEVMPELRLLRELAYRCIEGDRL